MSTTANTTGFKDNKEADEVKNALLNIKSQSSLESCPHRKTPVSQDIGTLHYDGKKKYLVTCFLVSLFVKSSSLGNPDFSKNAE